MTLRHILPSLIVALAVPMAVNAEEVTRYDLKVNDFTELKVVDDVNVIYRCVPDSAGHVVFNATPSHAAAFIFQPDGTKLGIELSPEMAQNPDGLPTVTVYSTFLSRAENDGKATLRIESAAAGAKIKCVLVGNGRLVARGLHFNQVEASLMTGNGEIVVSGKCDIAKLSSTGTGQIQADELVAREAKCRVVGTGSIGVNASDALTVSGMGSGTVYYLGNPSIKNRTLGVKTKPLIGDNGTDSKSK